MSGAHSSIKSEGSRREEAGLMVKNRLTVFDIKGKPHSVLLQKASVSKISAKRVEYLKHWQPSAGFNVRVKGALSEADESRLVVKIKRRTRGNRGEVKEDFPAFQREQAALHETFGIETYTGSREIEDADRSIETVAYFVSPLFGSADLRKREKISSVLGDAYKAESSSSRVDRLELALKMALNVAALQENHFDVFDVKPENFITSERGDLQIIDFTDPVATTAYRPPEITIVDLPKIKEKTGVNSSVFSLGLSFCPLFPEAGIKHLPTAFGSRIERGELSSSLRSLIEGMLDPNPETRCEISRVIQGLSDELAKERATHPVSKITDTHAPQAALIPEAYALYTAIVQEKLHLRESRPDQAEALRLIAIDLLNGLQNKNGQHLCAGLFANIADRLDECLGVGMATEGSAAGIGGPSVGSSDLVGRARSIAASPAAIALPGVVMAQGQFQLLIDQLNREITRLNRGDPKDVAKANVTVTALTGLQSEISQFIQTAPAPDKVPERKRVFLAAYQAIAKAHPRRGISFGTTTKRNSEKFVKSQGSEVSSMPFCGAAASPASSVATPPSPPPYK